MGKRDENINEIEASLDGTGLRVGIVTARFNRDICDGLLASATLSLTKAGVRKADIALVSVPGALELPLVLKKMAESGKYDALIALGAVIRGDTYHFEIVSNEMAAGITRVQLDVGVPIANGVLTTENDHQATARMTEKGRDCAFCAIEMARLLTTL